MSGKLEQESGKVKIETQVSRLTITETRNTLPTRRRASALVLPTIRSCACSASQFFSFALPRLSQREAARRRTRKVSRRKVKGGPSLNRGAASFFWL